MKSQMHTRNLQNRCRFIGALDAQIVTGTDEAAVIRPCHERNMRTRSQRCLGVITGDPRQTHARAAKSSKPQTQLLRRIRGKDSQARHRRRQTAAKSTTFMTGIRRFVKAYAILWQKLYACFSEHTFDQRNRVLVSRVAAHLDIRDRVSMKTGRLSQIPNRPIQRSTRHPSLCTCHGQEACCCHM
jgi:hypothetical protein